MTKTTQKLSGYITRIEQSGITKSSSRLDGARREDLGDGRMRSSCTRCYKRKNEYEWDGERNDVPNAQSVFKEILEAIIVVVSWSLSIKAIWCDTRSDEIKAMRAR